MTKQRLIGRYGATPAPAPARPPAPAGAVKREVVCADALEWLPANPGRGAIVTGLPDAAEISLDLPAYLAWFLRASAACLAAVAPGAPVIFCQTDRKAAGAWNSKAAILHAAALAAGMPCLWHKIVLRRRPGAVDIHRPGYSHLIAFGHCRPGKATPDVLDAGGVVYPNGMGLGPATAAIRFALAVPASAGVIVDPFVGRGTVIAIAQHLGGSVIGVDIDPDQCAYAARLEINPGLIPPEAPGPVR